MSDNPQLRIESDGKLIPYHDLSDGEKWATAISIESASKQIRAASDMLAGYAAACQMQNTLDWMEGLAERINAYLEAVQDDERVTTWGLGLQVISKDELK